jgi:hypothetical protein
MITGLPPYREPVVQDVRCPCGRYYRVFNGMDYQLRLAQKEAFEVGAIFIDARKTPFFHCKCSQLIDVTPEVSLMVQ